MRQGTAASMPLAWPTTAQVSPSVQVRVVDVAVAVAVVVVPVAVSEELLVDVVVVDTYNKI